MAQSIRNLPIGSFVRDSRSNLFRIVAHDHYGENQVTLIQTALNVALPMHINPGSVHSHYGNSEVHYYLNNDYLNVLDPGLKERLLTTEIKYMDVLSTSQGEVKTVSAKAFILAQEEVRPIANTYGLKQIPFFSNGGGVPTNSWTRNKVVNNAQVVSYIIYSQYGLITQQAQNPNGFWPTINVSNSTLVSENSFGGIYAFVFDEPPIIQNINNIENTLGKGTVISYTATDNGTKLIHHISFDNGDTWIRINPTKVDNTYTYIHVFDNIGNYDCRVKVEDEAGNVTVSNLFTVSIVASVPIVNIVKVENKVITFKASCLTHDIEKIEISINGEIIKTIKDNLTSNLSYEVDRLLLNEGKNSMKITATSTNAQTGFVNLEVTKTKYNLPPVGTKVIINDEHYVITKAVENDYLHTYTLDKELVNYVYKNDVIKIYQDTVKVYCSLSAVEDSKEYKEMKLVKTKKLRGQFAGYIEEKYELEEEGRYSSIKLELERFNTSVDSEIIELQQHFDYMED